MRNHFPRWVLMWLFIPNTWCVDLYSCAWVWLVLSGIHVLGGKNLKILDSWQMGDSALGVISLYIRSGSILTDFDQSPVEQENMHI